MRHLGASSLAQPRRSDWAYLVRVRGRVRGRGRGRGRARVRVRVRRSEWAYRCSDFSSWRTTWAGLGL